MDDNTYCSVESGIRRIEAAFDKDKSNSLNLAGSSRPQSMKPSGTMDQGHSEN